VLVLVGNRTEVSMNLSAKGRCWEGILGVGTCNTVAGLFRPVARVQARLYDLALVLAGSLLIGIAAQVAIPLPIVPVTGQTFAVLLLGALLGARLGAWTVLVYLMEGAAGLPVFSQGRSGLIMFLGPTGGYLVGFMAAAAVVGLLAQRGWDRRVFTTVAAMILGNMIIYAFGLFQLLYLSSVSGVPVGGEGLMAVGLYPFVAGDLIKTLLAAMLLPLGWRLLSKTKNQARPEPMQELP